jgi:endo-alpha-1,4-polygalactosaminidase (GH114 family)
MKPDRNAIVALTALTAVFSVSLITGVLAQQPGGIRAQGKDVNRDQQQNPQRPTTSASLVDARQEMRKLIRNISSVSRRANRNFVVVTMGGLELIEKTDAVDATRKSPATTYMGSIDGIIVRSLNMHSPEGGKRETRTDKKVRDELVRMADVGKRRGLRIMVADFAKTPSMITEAINLNKAKGYLPFSVDNPEFRFDAIPAFPKRPFRENAKNITGLKFAQNILFLTDSSRYDSRDNFVLALNETNFDAVVVDVYHRGRVPFQRTHVHGMKFKKLGAKRLVLAYMNVGQADTSRYYWKPGWREGRPGFLGSPVLGEPDNHYVQYWNPAWKKIIAGDTKSYTYGIIAQGYDGVVIDGVDSYLFFEGTTQ